MLMLSASHMQGDCPESFFSNPEIEGIPQDEFDILDDGVDGPHDVHQDDALVAQDDASKAVPVLASRPFLPPRVLATKIIERAFLLDTEKYSTNMHHVEVNQGRIEPGGMGNVTVMLIKDSSNTPGGFVDTNFGGFSLGPPVDPLGLGDLTNDFILFLIQEGVLKATSGVAQPWRFCAWGTPQLLRYYEAFCEEKKVPASTKAQTLERFTDGCRLQVRVCTTLPVCSLFFSPPYFNVTARSSLSRRAFGRCTYRPAPSP